MMQERITRAVHLSIPESLSARHVACGYIYGVTAIRATVSRELVTCGRCLREIARRKPKGP